MPKLPSKLKAELKAKSAHVCIACSGSGRSSKGGVCYPCGGKGIKQEWNCISCGANHRYIYVMKCRNSKCKLFGKEQ